VSRWRVRVLRYSRSSLLNGKGNQSHESCDDDDAGLQVVYLFMFQATTTHITMQTEDHFILFYDMTRSQSETRTPDYTVWDNDMLIKILTDQCKTSTNKCYSTNGQLNKSVIKIL